MSALGVQGLGIRDREGRFLLMPVDLELEAGRCLCLVGESGAGKSLVCAAVAGTLPPGLSMGGRIWLDGREITDLSDAERRALWSTAVFLLPQEPWTALATARTARNQVADMPRLYGSRVAGIAANLMERVGLSATRDGPKVPSQLSGGMAQRVALATTLGAPARLILVDEPTKGLDADRRKLAEEGLRFLLYEGRSVLLVTHDLDLARRLGDEAVVMREGQVVERGPASEVLTRPCHAFTRTLLNAEPSRWARRRSAASDILVTAENLAVSPVRGGVIIARSIAFSIRRGGITALSGPSGCGKTTLGDTVLGLRRPAAGRLHRQGRLVVQKLYQDPGAAFAPWRTIRATMSDALAEREAGREALEDLCRLIFSRLGLNASMLDRRPGAVSGGELQRLALARALLAKADLVFADEPTSRLDAVSQKQFMELLHETAGSGVGILLASHDRDLLAASADETVFLP